MISCKGTLSVVRNEQEESEEPEVADLGSDHRVMTIWQPGLPSLYTALMYFLFGYVPSYVYILPIVGCK